MKNSIMLAYIPESNSFVYDGYTLVQEFGISGDLFHGQYIRSTWKAEHIEGKQPPVYESTLTDTIDTIDARKVYNSIMSNFKDIKDE